MVRGDDLRPIPPWSELEAILGHVFKKSALLERSVTHSSLAYERATGRVEAENEPLVSTAPRKATALEGEQDNEQLEFLGDAVLGLVVADYLYRSYPDLQEGDLTRLRAQLVSRKHLGQVAAALSLGTFMRLGRGEERSGGRQKAVLLANALEAVIAALYLDGGLKAATKFVLQRVVEPYMEDLHSALEAGLALGDHKSALQEWLQAHKAGSPRYTVKAESGPDHRKRFVVEVAVVGNPAQRGKDYIAAQGTGSTKKKAEQEAARLAYAALLTAEHQKQEEAGNSPLEDRAS